MYTIVGQQHKKVSTTFANNTQAIIISEGEYYCYLI